MGLFKNFLTKFTNQATVEGPFSMTDPGLINAFVGLKTYSGKAVTRQTALRCSTFLSAVKMIASDVAKMPLELYERTQVNGRQRTNKAITDALYPVLRHVPNPWMTSYQLRWKLVFDLLTEGNFYCQVLRNNFGEVVQLYPLNPWCMASRWDRKTVPPTLYFDYDDGQGTKKTYNSTDLWWCSHMNLYGPEGVAMVALAKEALSILMSSDELAGRFFANGLFANGFISIDKDAEVDPAEAQKLSDDLKKFFTGARNAGGSPILPFGATYQKMALTAVEAQLMEGRKWNSEEVVRLLGGQPLITKLGYGKEATTYAASAAQLEEYFNTVILPITENVEQSVTRDLIDPADQGTQYARHNSAILLRGSSRERAETNKILLESGQRSFNELREDDDKDPVEGWDKYMIPAQSAVYDPAKDELILPAQKNPGDVEIPLDGKKPPVPPTPTPATARFKAIAETLSERVLRKETKSGTPDAKFVVEVLNVTAEQAEAYCTARASGNITAEQAKAALIALVIGETHES
jgi:HK97 family phage portal protein